MPPKVLSVVTAIVAAGLKLSGDVLLLFEGDVIYMELAVPIDRVCIISWQNAQLQALC